jgi:hypothetical protein
MAKPNPIRAAVFVLSSRLNPDVAICVQYCLERRYHVITIIQNDWHGAIDYIRSGKAEVLVMADEHSLKPAPRVEIVSHQPVKPTRPDVAAGRNQRGREARSVRTARITRQGAGA